MRLVLRIETDSFLLVDGTQVTLRRLVVPRETTMSFILSLCLRPFLSIIPGKPGQGKM